MSNSKEKRLSFFPFDLFRKKKESKSKSENKPPASVLTVVGLYEGDYRPHDPSKHVTLEQIKPWPEYYNTELKTSDDTTCRSQFEVNESLNERVSLWRGDISTLKIDAIVNSAGSDLVSLGDVGEDIHLAAGPELGNKCFDLQHCRIGDAVVTKGYKLPAQYVIHTVPPRQTHLKFIYLKKCYQTCLNIARDKKIKTIAFPCLGTQFCGYDEIDAAKVAISTTREWLREKDNMLHIDRIIFSVYTDRNDNLYKQNLKIFFPVEQPETVPHVISLDPHALDLYQKAIKEGKERDQVIRVNIVGNFGQGKTSLKRRLAGKSVDGVTSTNGIDVDRYKFKRSSIGKLCPYEEEEGQEIVSRLVEVARKTELESSLEVPCRPEISEDIESSVKVDASFNLNVDDSNNDQDSLTDVKVLYSREDESLQSSEDNISVDSFTRQSSNSTCGTPKRTLTENEMLSFTKDIKLTDSKEATNAILDFWDFGGQYVFYATHTMFHSQQAIYLLVFDLTVKLDDKVKDEEFPGETGDKTVEYFIRFWVNSIHSFVGNEDGSLPRVILVGTHKDKIKADSEKERTEYCEAYFDKIRQIFDDTTAIQHIQVKDFAVDNVSSDDETISELLEEIISIGDELSKRVEIPAKWLPLERSLKERRSLKSITFEEIMEIDGENEFPLFSEDQVKLFLQYHHCKGTLFYFDEEPISQYVILDPQFLIDAFKCIITSSTFRKDILKQPCTQKSWRSLIHDGKLENELIEKVWDSNFIAYKEILLGFLKKHHVISEAMEFNEDSGKATGLGWYIVPSLLKHHSSTDDVSKFISDRNQSKVRLVMLFDDSSLLQTIFSRLIAALLGKWSLVPLQKKPKRHSLFENLGMFRLDSAHVGLVEVRTFTIELFTIGLTSNDIVNSVGDRFRRYCESVIKHEFECLRSRTEVVKKPYRLAFRCNHKTHCLDGSNEIKVIETETEYNKIPCPDLEKHDVCVNEVISEWYLTDQIDTSNQNKKLTDKVLSEVAKAIGNNWQMLGIDLGLSQVQIDQVSADNNTMLMTVFNMLKKWKSQSDCKSIGVLIKALNDVKDRVRIDWDVVRNICDSND